MTSYQRIDGPTPGGGDYSEIYYFDNDNNIVDKDKATKCVIRECLVDGTLISETFGIFDSSHA